MVGIRSAFVVSTETIPKFPFESRARMVTRDCSPEGPGTILPSTNTDTRRPSCSFLPDPSRSFSSPRFRVVLVEAVHLHRGCRSRALYSSHRRAVCVSPLPLPARGLSSHLHPERTCASWFSRWKHQWSGFPFRRPDKVRNVHQSRGSRPIVCPTSGCHSGYGFRWCAREYVQEVDRRSSSPLWLSTTWSAPPLSGNPMSAQIRSDKNNMRRSRRVHSRKQQH